MRRARSEERGARSGLRRRRAAGFSIIELMIAGVIALVIFGIGLMMITGASQAHSEAKARIRTNDKARMFFEQFQRDFSGAYTGGYRRDALVAVDALISGNGVSMTTTTEDSDPGAGTEFQSVRYYVVKATKRLCRETKRNMPLPAMLSGLPNVMLCADVDSLETRFKRWTGSEYIPRQETDPDISPSEATHLLVKLTILDPNVELGNPDSDQRKRIYQVYVPISDGLLP